MKDFIEKLIREGWTQKQIAEKAGIHQQMISRFLKGQECTVPTAWKIADAFGVTLDEVVGRTPPKKRPHSNSLRDHGKVILK